MIDWVQRVFLSQLMFADDMALVAESADEPQCFVREFVRVCERRKLVSERGKQIMEI